MFNLRPLSLALIIFASSCASTCPLKSQDKSVTNTQVTPAKTEQVHYIAQETTNAEGKKQICNATIKSASDCKATRSAHNRVIYIPFVGPLFDLQTVPNSAELEWWEFPVSTLIPVAGPSIVRTLGSQICIK